MIKKPLKSHYFETIYLIVGFVKNFPNIDILW